ncbi:MAG: hypothetical protein CMH64_00940 [Nanoarchaeota archaeon]|nr:hypothetical protein [Nanoarchaeota archaeon]|tara:strand:+ start:7844 stop:8305 length:462 start_codon:yes stop_codon:yes gene_type:complete
MEYRDLVKGAIRSIKRADHLTYMTLPLVKDNKLILSIMENIQLSFLQGMDALLEYERLYKRIMPLPQNFESRFDIFRDKLINKYDITSQEVELIRMLRETIQAHKSSPIEFSRPDKFVICSENYRMKTISVQEIKQYILAAKSFLRKVENIVK